MAFWMTPTERLRNPHATGSFLVKAGTAIHKESRHDGYVDHVSGDDDRAGLYHLAIFIFALLGIAASIKYLRS